MQKERDIQLKNENKESNTKKMKAKMKEISRKIKQSKWRMHIWQDGGA